MDKKEFVFEAPEKPELEDIKEILPDTSEFEEPEKAQALIKNLSLSVGDTIKEDDSYFTINPRMVLEGNKPKHYKDTIDNLKKILTEEEIKLIDNYIKRKKENDKVRDVIYHSIEKRTDKFYWRSNIKKSLPDDIKEVLEFFKDNDHTGINNTIYHLLSKDNSDYVECYKCAWKNKPIPNIQTWAKKDDGEYRVLTDSEADREADDYLTDDQELWKMAVENGNTTASLQDWADDVLSIDGRGSVLGGYDGCEENEEIEGIDYYIYRHN